MSSNCQKCALISTHCRFLKQRWDLQMPYIEGISTNKRGRCLCVCVSVCCSQHSVENLYCWSLIGQDKFIRKTFTGASMFSTSVQGVQSVQVYSNITGPSKILAPFYGTERLQQLQYRLQCHSSGTQPIGWYLISRIINHQILES